jgi:predicted CXXCH cytochrome family protein
MKLRFNLLSLHILITVILFFFVLGLNINCAVKVKKEKPKCRVTECPLEYGISEDAHKPVVTDECAECHEEGAIKPSRKETLYSRLLQEGRELCFECHDDLIDKKNIHEPVEKDCRYCHIFTKTDAQWLLKGLPGEICYFCHTELSENITKSMYVHTPVKQNDCSACHDPHSSDNTGLLKKHFPEESFVPYKAKSYELCFDCHNKEIATEQLTKNLTRFRNGDMSLHYIHVNNAQRGMSCKICHNPHAGTQPMNMPHVSCGVYPSSWPMPFEFLKFDTGGRCATGCHEKKYYDRKDPVEYK